MPYTPQTVSPSIAADGAVLSRFARRFIALVLIGMLCAILAYSAAAFLLPVPPRTVFSLATCDTPASVTDWLRLCTGWLSGVIGQLLFVFLGTTGAFSVWFGSLIAIWRGFVMGSLLWLFMHTSIQTGNVNGDTAFLLAYFAVTVLLFFYIARERRASLFERLPGFLLLSGTVFCLYFVPLYTAVIFL